MCETAADDIRFGVNTMNLKHLFVAVTAALLVLSSDATKAGQTINDGGARDGPIHFEGSGSQDRVLSLSLCMLLR